MHDANAVEPDRALHLHQTIGDEMTKTRGRRKHEKKQTIKIFMINNSLTHQTIGEGKDELVRLAERRVDEDRHGLPRALHMLERRVARCMLGPDDKLLSVLVDADADRPSGVHSVARLAQREGGLPIPVVGVDVHVALDICCDDARSAHGQAGVRSQRENGGADGCCRVSSV
jgi:hypothetical protein